MLNIDITTQYPEFFREMDFGIEKQATMIFKTQLLRAIKREIKRKRMTHDEAVEQLGINQFRLADVVALRPERFNADLLVKILFRLGIQVSPELRIRNS